MEGDISLGNEQLRVGDALIGLYRICTDLEHSKGETPHYHSYYELHLVVHGEYLYNIEGKAVSLHNGEMILIHPNLFHNPAISDSNVKISVLSITIKKCDDGQAVYSLLKKFFDSRTLNPVQQPDFLSDLILEFDQLCCSFGLVDMLKRKELSSKVLMKILDAYNFEDHISIRADPIDFDILLETLVFNSNKSLRQIAAEIGYSQRQISRIIKDRFGVSFAKLRSTKR